MQSYQVQAVSVLERNRRELGHDATFAHPQPMALNNDMIERAARALFEFVFSSCARLDGKHGWTTCDDEIKEGFRAEATAVIVAAWPQLRR